MVDYKEKSVLGGYSIEVYVNKIQVGSIRRHGSGDTYSFYKGVHNQLTPSLTNLPLPALKAKLEQMLNG
ncbi:MAG: hypothetical protein ACOKSU_27655 [Pseudomonas sp.]|uniref:hypothetical protein n=1 Tax=Pseudomonas TaxID=286 RepID=UPI0003C09EC6|nr:hypothetical protein [Pseudomonas sp. VLB120]AGZ34645.1 hypothetical protein PVLB_09235 [Pseudomonas sp. VLB120]